MKKFFKLALRHKFFTTLIIAALVIGGYFSYQKFTVQADQVSYLTAPVTKGLLSTSISGIGQVLALNQVEIKPKVSGDLVQLNVTNGQQLKAGQIIGQLDSRNASRNIKDAQANLDNAKLGLAELMAPADAYTLLQAQHALTDAEDALTKLKTSQENNYQTTQDNKNKAQDNLDKAYDDAYNDIANAFLDLPDIMTGLYTVLLSDELSKSEISVGNYSNNNALINAITDYNYRAEFSGYVRGAEADYHQAKSAYEANFSQYKNSGRSTERAAIDSLLTQTLATAKRISDTVKSETNMADYWVNYRTSNGLRVFSDVISYQVDLSGYTSKINSHLSGLLAARRAIDDDNESIKNAERDLAAMQQNNPLELAQAERSIEERRQRLLDLQVGPSQLEIKNQQLQIQQRQNALSDAQQAYADYVIRAPFDGQLTDLAVAKGNNLSGGSVIASLLTDQKIAEITLNEIDAAKVKPGQKTSLSFDALPELSLSGSVAEVATLGAVSQGVVSYKVKISFDVQNENIKPGMSVSAAIITAAKPNVIMAPLSAIKTSSNGSYAEALIDNQLQRKTVTTGLSNDTMVEIIDGLAEGEQVITQTVVNNGAAAPATVNSSFGQRNNAMGGLMRLGR